jgi:hypothetical protein
MLIEELRSRIHIRTGILVLRDLACLPQAGYIVLRTWYSCTYFQCISLSPFFPVLLPHELLIR